MTSPPVFRQISTATALFPDAVGPPTTSRCGFGIGTILTYVCYTMRLNMRSISFFVKAL